MIDVLLGVVLVLQSGAPQQARNDTRLWYQAYADAQQKIQKQDWLGAIADIELASRRGAPKPGRNVLFYGDVYRDFNPDYYLGVAYLNLNRYDEASGAFERVRQAQIIRPSDPLSKNFVSQAATAKELLAKSLAPPVAATSPPVASTANPPVTAAANPPLPAGGPSTAPTLNVDQKGYVPPGQQSTIQAPPVGNTAAQRPPAPQPSASVRPPANRGGSAQPAQQPPIRAPDTKTSYVPPTQQSPIVPVGDERSALVDFFSGDYLVARNKLDKLVAAGNASPRARLYLACSLVALGLSGGADRSASVAAARTQLALAGNGASFSTDLSLISPRIRGELGLAP